MTWAEVIRKLTNAGYVEVRHGKGSHRLFRHVVTGKEIWVAVHTKKTRVSWATGFSTKQAFNDDLLSDCD